MTLVDAGPLVAILDRGQQTVHQKCVDALARLPGPLLTTWPCATEAMYFLGELHGWHAQAGLWRLLERRALLLHVPGQREVSRMAMLMEQYQNVPMDLADASLVAAAEESGLRLIFTLDSDFQIYRIDGRDPFTTVP